MKNAVSRSYPVMLSIFGSVRARVSMEPVTGSLRYFINFHIHLLVYLVKTCKFFKVNFRIIVELAVGAKYNQIHRISVSFSGFRCFILAGKETRPPWGGTRRPTGAHQQGSYQPNIRFVIADSRSAKNTVLIWCSVQAYAVPFFFQILKSPHLAG